MAPTEEPAKLLLPFLQRADELQKHDPRIAYYCRLYAMEKGLSIPPKERTKQTNALLLTLMGQLEKDKKQIKVNSDDNLYVEGFALNIFAKADKIDRAGRADISTAKTFYAAGIFLEVLRQFSELSPDLEQKLKYAVWKAADIRKSVSEGRKPTPGPPNNDDEFEDESGSIDSLPSAGGGIPKVSPQPRDQLPPPSQPSQLSQPLQPQFSHLSQPSIQSLPPPSTAEYTQATLPSTNVPSHSTLPSMSYSSIPPTLPSVQSLAPPSHTLGHSISSYSSPPPVCDIPSVSGPSLTSQAQYTHIPYSSSTIISSTSSSLTMSNGGYSNYASSYSNLTPDSLPHAPSSTSNIIQSQDQYTYQTQTPQSSSASNQYYSSPSFSTSPIYPSSSGTTFQQTPQANVPTVSIVPTPAQPSTLPSIQNLTLKQPVKQDFSHEHIPSLSYRPPPDKIAEAHKAARFAVSALAFDDVPSAIAYLQKSLRFCTDPSASS